MGRPGCGSRYWGAMSVASVCGANIGDFVTDELGMHGLQGLPWLALLFAAVGVGRWVGRGSGEAWYWLAILTLRAMATNVADWLIGGAGVGYVAASAGLAVLLGSIMAARRTVQLNPEVASVRRGGAFYWLAMLTAGTLGTVVADGAAHVFKPVTVGVPAAGGMDTVAVILALSLRGRLVSSASYWLAIVAIRAWGTNIGDVAAYFLSRPVSMTLSGFLLAALLVTWRGQLPG